MDMMDPDSEIWRLKIPAPGYDRTGAGTISTINSINSISAGRIIRILIPAVAYRVLLVRKLLFP